MVERSVERRLALGGTLVLCALAWLYLVGQASGMASMDGMSDMSMPGMSMPAVAASAPTRYGSLFAMWSVMMVAMMLPSALPTILLFDRIGRGRRERSAGFAASTRGAVGTWIFVLGYLTVWTAYSGLAAGAQVGLQSALLVSPMMVSVSSRLSGALLLLAGAYQLTPLKDACISHCRSPLSFISTHWREGKGGAIRMGLRHGSYCVGCCWALMALLFVLGVMNLVWVLALAILVLLEKSLPGVWVTRGTGIVLLTAGVAVLLA